MEKYEAWLDDDRGRRLCLLSPVDFNITKTVNTIGLATISLPGNFNENLLKVDRIVEIWRAPAGGMLRLAWIGFLRKFVYAEDTTGKEVIQVSGPDVIELLSRRIIPWGENSEEAKKTDYADDMMKEVVSENFCTFPLRTSGGDISSLGFTVAGDVSLGPSVSLSFAYKNVLATLQAISDAAKQEGTEVYFDLVPGFGADGLLTMNFETFIGQPGADRTSGVNAIYFGKEWGNLQSPKLEDDYMSELTYMYAGGQGEGEGRKLVGEEDTGRSAQSEWNRREGFASATNYDREVGVIQQAKLELAASRPKKKFTGKLLESSKIRYMAEWYLGDRVSCKYRGMEFNGLIKSVKLSVGSDGNETIDASVEVEQ